MTGGAGTGGLPGTRPDQYLYPVSASMQAGSPQIIRARLVIVSGVSGGVFVYATPGPGNPPVYSMSNATSDPYNNTIFPGIWAGQVGKIQVGMQADPNGNFGQVIFVLPGGPYAADGAVFAVEQNGGAVVEISSAADSVNPDSVSTLHYDNLARGAGTSAWQALYRDISGGAHAFAEGNVTGFHIGAGSIIAVDPSTGSSLGNPFAGETWHNITTDPGWGSLAEPPQYQMLGISGFVALRGDISHAGTTLQTAVNSGNPLPLNYRPGATRYYRPPQAADGAGAIQVDSSGVVTMRASGFTATQAILDGIYSL